MWYFQLLGGLALLLALLLLLTCYLTLARAESCSPVGCQNMLMNPLASAPGMSMKKPFVLNVCIEKSLVHFILHHLQLFKAWDSI